MSTPASPLPRLVLRADGNPQIGLGHVMRLLAVAEIAGAGFERVFVTRDADTLRPTLAEGTETVLPVPALAPVEEAAWLTEHLLRPTDVVVLDGYEFGYDYQQAIRAAVGALLYLDDLHRFPQAADVVLNVAGGVPASAYDLRRPGARLLTGPTWAPLRAPFREPLVAASEAPLGHVLLCLGGADPADHTRRLAADLLVTPGVEHLHIVVGGAYAHPEALRAWAAAPANATRTTVHRALSAPDLRDLMQACGTAVLSASTVSYEYAAAGGGLLLILPTADNQRQLHDFLLREGLARPYTAALNILSAPDAAHIAADLRAAQRRYFDGAAPDRLRDLLRRLSVQARLQLRPATWADSDQLLAWANEPAVRRFSYNPDPIAREGHENWFRSKLADPAHLILVAEVAAQPAGTIRYVLDATGTATLSFLLGEHFRGVGLAPALLLAGTRAAAAHWGPAVRRVVGHVQQVNAASANAFRRAGFRELTDVSTPADSVTFEQTP